MTKDDPRAVLPTTTLVPARERIVTFYDDQIPIAQIESGELYVAIRPVTDYLGLAFSSQRVRINDDEVMAPQVRSVRMRGADGRRREMLCLPLDLLYGWLFSLPVARVKADFRPKLTRYRAECFRVLRDAFQTEATASAAPPPPAEGSMTLMQIRELGIAIQQLAEQALAADSRITHVEGRLDNAARFMGQFQKRLERVEDRVAPGAYLTDDQAATISLRVKAIAVLMLSQHPGKNPFQGIWTELFRDLGVPDSHHIPQAKYQRALDFLESWWRAITGPSAPPPSAG